MLTHKITYLFAFLLLLCLDINAQNVGIGNSNPQAKTHVTQTTAADGVLIEHSGTSGVGLKLTSTSATNTSEGISLFYSGLGRGSTISLSNASNTEIGFAVFNSGTGTGIYSQTIGTALYGYSTGNNITAVYSNTIGTGTVAVQGYSTGATSTAVSGYSTGNTSNGVYGEATGTGSAAVYGKATGTNSNAGNFQSTNASNSYPALNVAHNGTGEGIYVEHTGTGVRNGILSITNPNGLNDPIAVYGNSYEVANSDYGIGIQGNGGFYGVRGVKSGTNFAYTFGVYATGDLGATGAKSFIIDYPLDPTNKILRHYAIESNEVTNMYRGVIELDANGKATIELPEYFNAVNKNISYQLTGIGTSTPPYVLEEEANNQFVVGGAPNTKVSWVVYGERNDPTIQWYNDNGKNYNEEVSEKPAKMKGKYYTPEAYGKPESMGIHYRAEERNKMSNANNINTPPNQMIGGSTIPHPQPIAPPAPSPDIQNISPNAGDVENK